jgi:guanylate kinase
MTTPIAHPPHPTRSAHDPGCLFIVAAPSGAGKSTLVNALLQREADIGLSVSFTTRPPRPGEKHGEHYHFIDEARFEQLRRQGEFLEYAEVHGNFYGTSAPWLASQMQAGKDVLLEIDWQGARQVRKHFPQAVGVFILPPSTQALEARLKQRGQDSDSVIARRLLNAGSEMAHAHEFDYAIVNDRFELALDALHGIVRAARQRFAVQWARQTALLQELGVQAEP